MAVHLRWPVMDCDVFVLYAARDQNTAERVGGALRTSGVTARVAQWDRSRPASCRAAVLVVTSATPEIESSIASIAYHKIPVFALRLQRFEARRNLSYYLKSIDLTWIDGEQPPLSDRLAELAERVAQRLFPGRSGDAPRLPPRADNAGQKSEDIPILADPAPANNPEAPPPPPPENSGFPKTALPENPFLRTVKRAGGVLANVRPLRGFFSYSRDDDRSSEKALSKLREKITGELNMALGLGRMVELWQDTQDIRGGTRWQDEIRKGIETSVFFIPIITPNSINSPNCQFEFDAFREQEQTLGRSDLIFPILYIDVWQLKRESHWRGDERLQLVAERQFEDFTELRPRAFDDGEVKKFIITFCKSVAEALRKRPDDSDV